MPDEFGNPIPRQYCHVHFEGCQGSSLVTRKSVFDAEVTACRETWDEPIKIALSDRFVKVDLSLWPEVIPPVLPVLRHE